MTTATTTSIETPSGKVTATLDLDMSNDVQLFRNGEAIGCGRWDMSYYRFAYGRLPRLSDDFEANRFLYKNLEYAIVLAVYGVNLHDTYALMTPSEIPYQLDPSEGSTPDDVPNKEVRFIAANPEWVTYYTEEVKGRPFCWDDDWRDAPATALEKAFTFSELAKIQHTSVLMSQYSEFARYMYPLVAKLFNSHWQYGCYSHASTADYNRIAAHLEKLRTLEFAEGFTCKLTYTTHHNPFGPALHTIAEKRVFLDAPFGLMVFFKGEHVLTIGFALSRHGVLVSQVQLREKKGNRFLYQLPGNYFDVALEALYRAFGNELWLVTGPSAVKAIKLSYVDGTVPAEDAMARVETLYTRSLAKFSRTEEVYRAQGGRDFVRLERIQEKAKVSSVPCAD